MICGLGMDVVEIGRIRRAVKRFGQRFVEKILTPDEMLALNLRGANTAHALAARFAAKEAAVKALGTGFTQGIGFHHIEVRSLPTGQPLVFFYGLAAQRMADVGATRAHLSLTHGRDVAAAVVVLESA